MREGGRGEVEGSIGVVGDNGQKDTSKSAHTLFVLCVDKCGVDCLWESLQKDVLCIFLWRAKFKILTDQTKQASGEKKKSTTKNQKPSFPLKPRDTATAVKEGTKRNQAKKKKGGGTFAAMEEFDEALKSMFVEANRLATFDGVKWPFPKRRKCRPSNVSCLCCSFNSKCLQGISRLEDSQ